MKRPKGPEDEAYILALGWRRLTPYYDALSRRFMPEDELHDALLRRLKVAAGSRVLDVGCGTGTLALRLAREKPGVSVAGIDGDPEILAIAEEKRRRAGLPVIFRAAMAQTLPFARSSFDAAMSSFVFHHLGPAGKRAALAELFRVLKPGGQLSIMDLGPPAGRLAAFVAFFVGFFEETGENVQGKIPLLMTEAGFAGTRETYSRNVVFGTVRLYEGFKANEEPFE